MAKEKKTVVYELDPGEKVSCYYCMETAAGRDKLYVRGEAYLCGADHIPYDGNANYICKDHLEEDVVIEDAYTRWEEYKATRKLQKELLTSLRRAKRLRAKR